MFKSNWLSIFNSKTKTKPVDNGEIPKVFTISDESTQKKMINISMDKVDDDFVGINVNELTYAEVANLSGTGDVSGNKKVSNVKSNPPIGVKVSKSRKSTSKPGTNRLDEDELEESIHEKFKSDIHYKKHKQFKANEKKKQKSHKKKH